MSYSAALPGFSRRQAFWAAKTAQMEGPADEGRRRHRGHRHGPGPWMGGPGWFGGPAWGGGPGGPGGRRPRPRRGDVRAAIISLLSEQPMHGYQVITELSERSGGVWRPSPGSVYPTLQQLEDEGLVRAEESEGRRVFHLTDAGRAVATEVTAAGQRAPWETIADDADAGVVRLRQSAMQVAAALMQVASAGTDAQIARAEEMVTTLRRDLYRLLAEDDDTGQK
jgi:DNA-binding PadR family transcriptional regulator